MSFVYPWAFVVTFAGLMGWTLFADRKSFTGLFQGVFFIGFAGWLAVMLLADASVAFKLSIAFRDLMVVAVAAAITSRSRSNKFIGFIFLIGAGLFLKQFYLPVLKSTFGSASYTHLASDGELLLEINDHSHLESIQVLLRPYEATMRLAFAPADPESTELDDYYLVDLPSQFLNELDELKERLMTSPIVDWVEDNEIVQVRPVEGTKISRERRPISVNDPKASDQWALQALDISNVHRLLQNLGIKTRKTARVAILDTGVDAMHEDLRTNYKSIDSKYDKDINGHGTHVAGIVAATTNNKIGIASMVTKNSYVSISGIKVLSDAGFGSQAKIIQGMILAADNGADVISMSLGGPSSDKKQETYRKATEYCASKGAIVVVAAGNASTNAKSYAPANTPGVIAVSAINESLNKAGFSNEVQDLAMAVAAPGEDILSTFPKNQYRTFKGTSMAAPFVSSLIGVLKSVAPDLTTEEAYDILTNTGSDSDQPRKTGKIIQPVPALQTLVSSFSEVDND